MKIDDAHFGGYADFLVNKARRQNQFAKSKGWIKDEPDLCLVTVTDGITTPAEQIARNKEIAFLQSDDRKEIAQSGQRATYGHITGDILLQERVLAH